jgi:hypothetical protein
MEACTSLRIIHVWLSLSIHGTSTMFARMIFGLGDIVLHCTVRYQLCAVKSTCKSMCRSVHTAANSDQSDSGSVFHVPTPTVTGRGRFHVVGAYCGVVVCLTGIWLRHTYHSQTQNSPTT